MSNDSSPALEQKEFSKFRKMFWPIHGYELKKFIPMSLMMMFILFIYTIVRDSKDSLITGDTYLGGSYLLSFMKLWVVMPSAIVFMIIFVKLANKMSQERLFYTIVSFFVAFFVLYSCLLYRVQSYIHLSHSTIDKLVQPIEKVKFVGVFLKSWIVVIGSWSNALFYVMAELWGSIVLTALFWQFANMVTKLKEAKRLYPFYALIGNIGLILSGHIIKQSCKTDASGKIDFGQSLRVIGISILISGVLLLLTYTFIQKKVLTDPALYSPDQEGPKKKKKPKLGFAESMKHIFSSPYLLKLTVLMIGYGVCITLFEQVWKDQVRIAAGGDKGKIQYIMGNLSVATGYITMLATFFGINFLQKFKWRTVALFTPAVLMVIGAVFFVQVYISRTSANAALVSQTFHAITYLTKTSVFIAVIVGLYGNAIGKSVKYSMFDPTLQMAYLPLDPESKIKGQAAVSVVGGRAGKAGGSAIVFLLTNLFSTTSLTELSNIIGVFFFIIIGLWIYCVFSLSKDYEKKLKEQQEEELDAKMKDDASSSTVSASNDVSDPSVKV